MRFLRGSDEDFDYDAVDESEDYDDRDEEERTKLEEYAKSYRRQSWNFC